MAKSKAPKNQSQPWDNARRRQPWPDDGETSTFPLPKEIDDLGDAMEALFSEGELLSQQTFPEREKERERIPKKKYLKRPEPKQVDERQVHPCSVGREDSDDYFSLTPTTMVKGIILSEILQPPRAKRPLRK